ncbi:Hypothetical_protein [Hexamita inflata]|uniref:Hypothetical_protein n=1 Tax=Hexamita inflata TaxID=28002 RepID=A0AA86NQ25_9EUKA|nr:Hypothetical protein HINF_LOCUS11287 [Hexamita inflata]
MLTTQLQIFISGKRQYFETDCSPCYQGRILEQSQKLEESIIFVRLILLEIFIQLQQLLQVQVLGNERSRVILKQLSPERSVCQLSQQFVENLEFKICIQLNYNRYNEDQVVFISIIINFSLITACSAVQIFRLKNFKVKTMAFQFVK